MDSDGPLGWSDDGEEFNGVDDVDTTDLNQPEPAHDDGNDPGTPPGDDATEPDGPEESDAADDQNQSLEFDDLADDPEPDDDNANPDPGDTEATDDVPDATADPVPGADPDADPVADDPSWTSQDPFPPALNLDEPPEPVDGFPWTDPQALGDAPADTSTDDPQQPPVDDLYAYDGQQPPDNGNPWDALQRSEDPATSSLARFWSGAH